MQREHQMAFQDLLVHRGWAQFRAQVLTDTAMEGTSQVRKCLRSQIQDKVNASARAGDWEKTAYYTGQLDILEVVLNLPRKEITKSPNPFSGKRDRVKGEKNEL